MPYTPPSGDALIFDFTGGAYTPPSGSALSFALDVEGGGGTLIVASTTHAHTAEQPTLTATHTLVVHSPVHGHAAEQPTLSASHVLVVTDAAHAHTAEQPTLSASHGLVVADAAHAHTADHVELSKTKNLLVDSTTHGHTATHVEYRAGSDQRALRVDSVFARAPVREAVARVEVARGAVVRITGAMALSEDLASGEYVDLDYVDEDYAVGGPVHIQRMPDVYVRTGSTNHFARIS